MNVIEIKKWMLDNNLRQKDLCDRLKRARSTISMVLNGKATSGRILGLLRQMGCPERFLAPERKVA